jgi:hypothetical protein
MTETQTQVSIRGKQTKVPSVKVGNAELITTGSWLKIASIKDEDLREDNPAGDPEGIIQRFKNAHGKADIFSFSQWLPDVTPRYEYPMHWDNLAVLPIQSYSDWWGNLSQETRRNVRLAGKRGLVVTGVPFGDDFVRGIMGIYNETPFRQGRRFWHYGKDFATVKSENSTYVERSQFIGAYCGSELIGFIKVVYVNRIASIMQILSRTDHQDKRPTNALIAKTVEICAEKGVSHLVYCKYVYYKNHQDALTEFKRRNGFQQINHPRYFVPLTLKGRLAIALKLQLGLVEMLPEGVVVAFLKARARYNSMLQQSSLFQRV